MPKYKGLVGFIDTTETETDIYKPIPIERQYVLTLEKNSSSWVGSEKVNSDISLSNRLSFIADPYSSNFYQNIRYVVYNKTAWEVTSVDVSNPPRIHLSIGGLYNGKRPIRRCN